MNPFKTRARTGKKRRRNVEHQTGRGADDNEANALNPERAFPQPKMAIKISGTDDANNREKTGWTQIEGCLADSGCTHTLVNREFIEAAGIYIDTVGPSIT